MTTPPTHRPPREANEKRPEMPVQFLPSALLSWRQPIMARAGLPRNAGAKPPAPRGTSPGRS